MFSKIQAVKASVIGTVLALPVLASAAVPTELTSALDTSKTDVGTVAIGVLLIVVAIMVFKWMRKAL